MMAGTTPLDVSTGSALVLAVSNATTSTNRTSRGPFDESDYNTMEKGRSLNPVNHSFEDQAAIAIHLTHLASTNHTEFEKSGNEIYIEQRNLSELKSCHQELENVIRAAFCLTCYMNGDIARVWPLESSKYDAENETRKEIIEEHHRFWVGQLKAAEAILGSPPDHIATEEILSMGRVTESHSNSKASSMEFIDAISMYERRECCEWFSDGKKKEESFNFSEPAVIDQAFHDKYGDFPIIRGQAERILFKIKGQYMHRIRESYRIIGGLRRKLCMLRQEEKRCIAASRFSQVLAILKAPFNFLDLPRELRNIVWRELLVFDYNIAVTHLKPLPSSAKNGYRRGMKREEIWTIPIFQTSSYLRKEATEEFCKLNSFACRSSQTLAFDLGVGVSSFSKNIRNLSITWPTLHSSCIATAKAIRSMKKLENLTIHVNLPMLGQCPDNSMGGLNALRSIIDLPNINLPNLKRTQIVDVQLIHGESQTSRYLLGLGRRDILTTRELDWWYPQAHPANGNVQARLDTRPRATDTITSFDKAFSSRVLDAKTPSTCYIHGRQPFRPSILWPERNEKKKRQDERKGRPHVPIFASLDKDTVKERLAEIESKIMDARNTRLALVASEKDRLLQLKRLWEESQHFLRNLPYYHLPCYRNGEFVEH